MVEFIQVSGLTIICMVWVFISGQMEEYTKDNILKIIGMVMEYLLGLMEESIMVRGKREKCTVKAVILTQVASKRKVYGLKDKEH